MNFDASGRLWIASSAVYPQIQPGEDATDTIIVLQDTDADGFPGINHVLPGAMCFTSDFRACRRDQALTIEDADSDNRLPFGDV